MAKIWNTLAVAIPTFRRNQQLIEVLESISSQSMQPSVVLVVDNSPEDGAQEAVAQCAKESVFQIDYLSMSENLGPAGAFAAAVDALVRQPRGIEWMMCRGDDNPFDLIDAIECIHSFAKSVSHRRPAAIGITGVRYNPRTARAQRVTVDELLSCKAVDVDFIPGAGTPTYYIPTLAKRAINFDSGLFFGSEELDIGLRLKSAGELLLVDAVADYGFRQRTGRLELDRRSPEPGRRISSWRSYFDHRNRFWIARRHARATAVIKLALRYLIKAGFVLLARRDASESVAILYGLVDGVRLRRVTRNKYVPETTNDEWYTTKSRWRVERKASSTLKEHPKA